MRRALALVLLLALSAPVRSEGEADAFLPEDWIATVEPTHPDYWGLDWSVNNFMLPYRALQRGKHELETRLADNWRFAGRYGGPLLRWVAGLCGDFGLYMGTGHNIHHITGHDAAAREFDRAYGDGRSVPRRFDQMLPGYLGGGDLASFERQPNGRGADSNTRANVLPMESENTFAYEEAKGMLARERANTTAVERFLFHRLRFFMDLPQEVGVLNQAYLDDRDLGLNRVSGPGFSTDFTQYLYSLNTDRYGVRRVADFKIRMLDVTGAFALQVLDPPMWAAAYAYGLDYLGRGRNTTSLFMVPLGPEVRWLPGLRVYFSPFGLDYFQDNYVRWRGILANVYWMRGDNRYETRWGGGVDVSNIALPWHAKLGVFLNLQEQPLLSRIRSAGRLSDDPLRAWELGRTHVAYDVGGSLQVPVWVFGQGPDPRRLFLYLRAGTKSLAWFPGKYYGAGTYLQTGLGARL